MYFCLWNVLENSDFLFMFDSPLTFSVLSWVGVRHRTSRVVFLVHHVMPSSGGAVGARWYVPFGGGSSGLNSSMSWGSSGACGALQPASSLASSRRGSSLWGDSTRCLLHSGSTTGRWCVGPSATRWDFIGFNLMPLTTRKIKYTQLIHTEKGNSSITDAVL